MNSHNCVYMSIQRGLKTDITSSPAAYWSAHAQLKAGRRGVLSLLASKIGRSSDQHAGFIKLLAELGTSSLLPCPFLGNQVIQTESSGGFACEKNLASSFEQLLFYSLATQSRCGARSWLAAHASQASWWASSSVSGSLRTLRST